MGQCHLLAGNQFLNDSHLLFTLWDEIFYIHLFFSLRFLLFPSVITVPQLSRTVIFWHHNTTQINERQQCFLFIITVL